MKRQNIRLADIQIGDRMRKDLDENTVTGLMESIKQIGLQNPISVYEKDGTFTLASGLHRREAAMRLGTEQLECVVFDDAAAARLWEISENLHRSDLTALERDTHIAEWIRLTETKQAEGISRQPDAKQKAGRPEGGTRAAARELGISEPDARRAKAVGSLSPAAKKAAKDQRLDNNRSVLIKAAKKETAAEQVAVIEKHAAAPKAAAREKPLTNTKATEPAEARTTDQEVAELLAVIDGVSDDATRTVYTMRQERFSPEPAHGDGVRQIAERIVDDYTKRVRSAAHMADDLRGLGDCPISTLVEARMKVLRDQGGSAGPDQKTPSQVPGAANTNVQETSVAPGTPAEPDLNEDPWVRRRFGKEAA